MWVRSVGAPRLRQLGGLPGRPGCPGPPRKGGAPGQPPGLPHRGPWKAGAALGLRVASGLVWCRPWGDKRKLSPRCEEEEAEAAPSCEASRGSVPGTWRPSRPGRGAPLGPGWLRRQARTGSGGGRGGAGRPALVRALRVQIHLEEALTRQDDGRGFHRTPGPPLGGGQGAVTSARRCCLDLPAATGPQGPGAGPRFPAQPQGPPG